VDDFDAHWISGFCLTFISGKSAARVQEIVRGVASVPVLSEDPDGPAVAGVSDVLGGSVMLEPTGIAGAIKRFVGPLSEGGRLAVVQKPFTASRWFGYVQDGTTICSYNIDEPETRLGSDPDLVVPQLTETGLLPVIDLEWETEEEEDEYYENQALPLAINRILQAIAIASDLTGVEFPRQNVSNPQYFLSFADMDLSQDKLVFWN
jgi:hypothetical protein